MQSTPKVPSLLGFAGFGKQLVDGLVDGIRKFNVDAGLRWILRLIMGVDKILDG